MKKALSSIAQFLLFFATFAAGIVIGVFDPLHLKWFVTHPTPTTTHYFTPDGLILTVVVYLLVLGIEAARKIIRTSGPRTTIAFAVAVILGFLCKFGFAG